MNAAAGRVAAAIDRGLVVLADTQGEAGSWKGDYGGPLFLLPLYVGTLYALEETPDPDVQAGCVRYLLGHQNGDGGWGLDVEGPSQVFTSVLNYVALRLLGISPGDPVLVRARAWFLPRGGALGSASWGKFMLAVLGLYDYQGLHPILPELWLLPASLPVHPSRLWCHCRMVYLPMSWLYGRRAHVPDSPLLSALRTEIYAEPYATIDWPAAREQLASSDSYTPRTPLLGGVHRLLHLYERHPSRRWRDRSLALVLAHISAEDEATQHICIGPVNKIYNTLVWHFANPGGKEVQAHKARLGDYLWRAPDGMKMNGYNSSELWDTAFAVQAMVATGRSDPRTQATLRGAYRFLEQNQVLHDVPRHETFFRHRSQGGWPFSTRTHGWPISDCTAEGLKATLLLHAAGFPGAGQSVIDEQRQGWAVDEILSLQNADGGWATYEQQRGPGWLEALNPSDVFAAIMVDTSYVECTSACVQALVAFRASRVDLAPGRRRQIDRAVAKGRDFILSRQAADGSWEGSWGICFTYGTWFGIWGLRAAGLTSDHPAVAAAAQFLLAHQRADGAWGETIESCRQRRYVQAAEGQAVMTSWALLGLWGAGRARSRAVTRGVEFLLRRQGPDGRWPEEQLAGVFNKTCGIHYHAYLLLFPPWALALCGDGGA